MQEDESDLLLLFKNKPLFDGTFFIPENIRQKVIIAKCALCIPNTILIRGPTNSTSNFLKHLKKKHPGTVDKYNKNKAAAKNLTTTTIGTTTGQLPSPLIQSRITQSFSKKPNQSLFDVKLIRFVAETMSPISIIEHDSFKNLFTDFKVHIMTRKTFVKKIKHLYETKIDQIKSDLNKCDFVCTTADIWSARKRSFLGITCHWIEKETFQRKSAALACERFSDAHTFDRIAEKLHDVFTKFNLDVTKNVATVIDNGSNFVKSFKEFGIKTSIFDSVDPVREVESHDEDVIFVPLAEENTTADDYSENSDLNLPRHLSCASHTFNLLATTDVNFVINSSAIMRSRHTNILHKFSDLWKYASKPKSAEVLENVLGHSLIYPTVTRWNSFYDSISQILSISKENMNKLSDELQIKEPLKDADTGYLQEYCAILKPVAETVDFLQDESNTYFGYLIPSITSLQLKLQKVKTNITLSRSASFILDHLIDRLNERFHQYLDFSEIESKEAIIAAVTCPNVKFKWLTESVSSEFKINLESVKQAVIHAGVEFELQFKGSEDAKSPQELERTGNISFFEFESETPENERSSTSETKDLKEKITRRVQLHLLQYLEDKRTTLPMLNDYPEIKTLFLRYNTIIPSSAPVERLFSFEGMINSPKRQQLSDELFQILVLLKANGIKA